MYFQRSWCNIVEALPSGLTFCRGWDLGASFPTADNPDPDWTTGTLIGLHKDGRIFVVDHVFDRVGPLQVRQMIKGTAQIDRAQYGRVITAYPQDPGQAGKSQAQEFSVMLKGFEFTSRPVTGDKVTRFGPFSAQAEAGNVYVLRGPWNKRWFDELENFPPGTGHDDDADSTAEAYNALTRPRANLVTGRYGQGTRRRG
jgi:predicted phage terminase large subunit-like protein